MTAKRYRKLMRALLTRMSAESGIPVNMKALRHIKIVGGSWATTGVPSPKSYRDAWEGIWLVRDTYGIGERGKP